MRIALVVGTFPSLSQTFILNQATGLLERGHNVEIYSLQRGGSAKVHPDVRRFDLLGRTRYLGPRATRWRHLGRAVRMGAAAAAMELPRLMWRGATGARRAVRPALAYLGSGFPDRAAFDVIHCHFGPVGAAVARLRRRGWLNGPLLTSFHGWDATVFPRLYRHQVYRSLFRDGELFTANSGHTSERLQDLGCPAERITIHPVGIDPSDFALTERELTGDEPVRLLTVARLVPEKGLEYAIRAVARLRLTHPEVAIEYTIAGGGPLLSALRSLLAELGLDDRVRLIGWVDAEEVRTLLGRAHLFVLPSIRADDGAEEGAGVVLMEAQAAGIPVLATRIGGIPEVVLDGRSALLVQDRDADALADGLARLIEREGTWAEMGREGRAYVEERFDIRVLNRRLVDRYESLRR